MKKKIAAAMLAVMMVGCLILSGCSGDKDDKKDGETGESVSVKISAINAVSWAPLFIAESEGFFEEEGLDVEFTTPGGPKGFQAMHAGDCDFAMLSQEPLLIAQEQGMESTIIATMLDSRVYGIISTPDIKSIEQLKGKTIFGSDAGSAPYTFVNNVLKIAGLDPLKDVNFVQIGDNNAGLQAFLNGEVDAAFVNMYSLPVAKDFDYNILVDTTEAEQCEKYLGSAEFPAEMLCATSEYVKENPEICQKVVNALVKAQKWIAEHSEAEVGASLKPVFGDIEEDVIAEQVALIKSKFSKDCMITEEGQKAVIDMCVEAGIIKEAIPYEEIVDMSFVKNVEK